MGVHPSGTQLAQYIYKDNDAVYLIPGVEFFFKHIFEVTPHIFNFQVDI